MGPIKKKKNLKKKGSGPIIIIIIIMGSRMHLLNTVAMILYIYFLHIESYFVRGRDQFFSKKREKEKRNHRQLIWIEPSAMG